MVDTEHGSTDLLSCSSPVISRLRASARKGVRVSNGHGVSEPEDDNLETLDERRTTREEKEGS